MDNLHDVFSGLKSSVKGLRRFSVFLILTGIGLIVGTFLLRDPDESLGNIRIFMFLPGLGCFIIAIILRCIASVKAYKLQILVTDNVTAKVLQEAFELTEYLPGRAVAHDIIRKSDLIKRWDDRSGSDLVRGRYKGCNFEFSDIELTETITTVDHEGNTTVTVNELFKGQWIVLQTKTEIPGELRLREKARGERLKSNIETESIAFNNKFQIEAREGKETFFVLTPLFMEQITEASDAAKGRIYMYFSERQVQIAIYNSRNLFELSSRKKDHREMTSLLEYQRNEVKYITDIMDIILRNEKLF